MINKIVTMLLIITSLISCIGNKSNERVDSDEDQTVESILQSNDGDMFMLIGTYTSENGSKGIYVNLFYLTQNHLQKNYSIFKCSPVLSTDYDL
jgi:hypothetical protein